VQVDPIKPTLKAPGTKRLKLICHDSLSNFGFKFNLRRFDEGADYDALGPCDDARVFAAGAGTRPLLSLS
jgi:hypothetical protein